jgi:hypothetical protein
MRKILSLLFLLAATDVIANEPALTIHEWGTFTSLQDESGKAVSGINSDEEPLPTFTHNLDMDIIGDAASQRNNIRQKGYPRAHPDVTMRLETPVIYFHPTPGITPPNVDVSVQFIGGYLTQFYPKAESWKMDDAIAANTRSRLEWRNLTLGLNRQLPETTSHVWTAPRNVDGVTVTNTDGETEKFLFYRGVAHLDAPLRLAHDTSTVEIHGQLDSAFPKGTPLKIKRLWFCEFHDEGHCAFRELDPITLTADRTNVLASTPIDFKGEDFTIDHLKALKKSMRAALIEDGLNADEADALLATWEFSYFKSYGTRLFFLVPREWTDRYLPIHTTPTAPLSRVLVGRIDLVTAEHRRLLRLIADDQNLTRDEESLWKTYERLGRFRNALLLNELARQPSTSLKTFIDHHGLEASR